jgi:hypothetical protein
MNMFVGPDGNPIKLDTAGAILHRFDPEQVKALTDAMANLARAVEPNKDTQRDLDILAWIAERHDTVRVSGDVACQTCGKTYYQHVSVSGTFHLLCDGRIGKT